MNLIRADIKKNRLYIKLESINEGNAIDLSAQIRQKALKLKSGFTVLTDLSDYHAASQRFTPIISLVQEFLLAWGAGKIVRVTSSIVVTMQFERLGKESGIDAQAVATVEEAERILDWWEAECRAERDKSLNGNLKKHIKDGGLAFRMVFPK